MKEQPPFWPPPPGWKSTSGGASDALVQYGGKAWLSVRLAARPVGDSPYFLSRPSADGFLLRVTPESIEIKKPGFGGWFGRHLGYAYTLPTAETTAGAVDGWIPGRPGYDYVVLSCGGRQLAVAPLGGNADELVAALTEAGVQPSTAIGDP